YKEKGKFKSNYEAVYPMNGVERGMVYHSLKGKSSGRRDNVNDVLYHEQYSFRLPIENLSFPIFEKAMHLIIQKHPAFRKIYDLEVQAHIVLKEITPEINFIDIAHLNEEQTVAYINEKRKEEILNKTGLSLSLLWRVSIIKTHSAHYFLFDFHHSLLDGWSLQSFLTELNNLYHRLLEDEQFTPEGLKVSYYDQILAETARVLDESTSSYWAKEFEDYKRLTLPETGLKHEHKVHRHDLSGIKPALEEVAAKHQSNLKHICFAAFVYGMNMLSESNDITVGITTNNRPVAIDGEKLLGCFLNTLPIRVQVPKEATWGQYIATVEEKLRQFKKHDQTPFYKILDILGETTNDQNPIFDVFFNYIDFHVLDGLVNKEAFSDELDFDNFMITNNQLTLHFNAVGEHLDLLVSYSTAILNEAFSAKLAQYIENICLAFIHKAAQINSADDVKSEEEKQQLHAFNDTSEAYDLSKTVLDLFKEQVDQFPNRIALTYENQSKTYRALDECTDRWAANLLAKGVGKGDVVGLIMDRSIDMITAILSIFKLGGSYLPIDPSAPESRMQHMLSEMSLVNSGKLVLSNLDNLSEEIRTHYEVLHTTVLDRDQGNLLTGESPSPHDLAYIIYTSGSTGLPKGVCNTHQGLTNRLIWMQQLLGLTHESILFQKTPYTFDVSVWELLMFTITGSELVIAKPEGHKDPAYLQELIANNEISLVHFVPSMLREFLAVLVPEKCKNLQQIVCSGEALPSELVEKCKSLIPWVKIYNFYGPTEAAIDVTAIELTAIDTKVHGVSIGKPVANTQLYVVDNNNQLQPIGVQGELLIGGVQVANGYLNRPELTAERFIPNPFNANDAYKLYKTGDLGKWNSDGTITYLGRIDDQVKLNGVRIEPEEIESHLNAIAEVGHSAVMVREIEGNKHLVAYYMAAEKLDEDKLRNHLFEHLPMSMIPSYYVQLERFPSTSSGKLNRKLLPLPSLAIAQYVAPTNEAEQRLVEVWSEVLKRDVTEISITHNFFQLGGNSLRAMMMSNMLNKVFSVHVSLESIFEYPTLRSLAAHVERLERQEFISIPQAEKLDFYPLSSAQQRMYFLYEFDKTGTTYNMPMIFELMGKVEVAHLEAVFTDLINRHESLRTVFELGSSGVRQRVIEQPEFTIPVTAVAESEVEQAFNQFIRPFELAVELPIRVEL
ncbi:MAG: non-ribosomal peptide synthetase, partial [Flammeovirgaceae bacterium]